MPQMSDEFVKNFDIENMKPAEAEVPAGTEGATEAGAEVEVPVEVETPVEAPVEAPKATEETAEEKLWGGRYKTPDELEKGFAEMQAWKDREIAEIRAKVEAYENLLNSSPEPEPQQVMVTEDQFVAGVEQAPVDTFQWTMQNRPDLIPSLVGLVREKHGHVMADQMQATFNNAVMQAQQAQMMEQFQSKLDEVHGPVQMKKNFDEAVAAVGSEYGEAFDALREQTAAELEKLGELESYDPDTVKIAVEYAFLKAYRASSLNAPAPAVTPSPQEFVETGTPGQAVVTKSRDDKIREETAEAFKKIWM